MAKKDDLNLPGLCQSILQSRLARRHIRRSRREAVRQYVGMHWTEEGTSDRVPVNLVSLFVNIYGRSLIPQNPRVLLTTFVRAFKPTVHAMESAINDRIEHIRLADILQRIVIDALFNMGLAKVALASPSDAAVHSWNLRAGEPFVERVDEDDFVCDTHARDWSELAWVGHRYRVPIDTILFDSKNYTKERKLLTTQDDEPFDIVGEEYISMLGRTYVGGITNEWGSYTDLWEIYLPRQRLVLTLPDDRGMPKPSILRVQRWLGPDTGPYHPLGMQVVPGNLNPKAPIQDLIDLHEAINNIFRKLIRTMERLKENIFVSGGAMEDGSRVMHADDGEIIRVDHPEDIKQIVSSGQHVQALTAVATALKDLFGYMGGNMDIVGGLSPQSKTAHQDEMLNQNSSRVVNDMQRQVLSWVSNVVNALCWYEHHHPTKTQVSQFQLPGLPNYSITRQVTPEQRARIPYDSLKVQVDPYSLQPQTPQMRAQALMQLTQQILIPLSPQLQQQGVFLDLNALLQKIGRYQDMPDLQDIITIREPPQNTSGGDGGPDKPGMPQSTTRNYVRSNRSEQTREASDRNLVASMLGHNTGGSPNGPQGSTLTA